MSCVLKHITCKKEAAYDQAAQVKSCLDQFLSFVSPPVSAEQEYEIWLGLHEIFINIVDHAYGGRGGPVWISMHQRTADRMVEILLRDEGDAFAPAPITCPDPARLQEGGYGLFLVSKLFDEAIYTPGEDGNLWWLVKNLKI